MSNELTRITSADGIIEAAKSLGAKHGAFRVAVAAAEDDDVLRACSEAANLGFAEFTLFGSEKKLKEIGESKGIDLSKFKVADSDSAAKSAHMAAEAADQGKADLIMKGFISTSALLKTVLSHDFSLRVSDTVSHIAVLDIPGYHKLLGLTDGGMVVKPTFEQKVQLIKNAVTLFHTLGYDNPKVAVSSPVDYIHPKMPETTEAAQLTAMNKSGEIKGCEVYGPVTFDAATNRDVAIKRGVQNYVAGAADIFLVDTIEECNIISKVLILFAQAAFAGVIVGAKVPVSLVSRTDTARNKLASISVACVLAHHTKGSK